MDKEERHELAEAEARIADLEQQLRQRDFELEVLAELSQKINYPLNDKELLVLLLEQIHKALSVDVCAGLIAATSGGGSYPGAQGGQGLGRDLGQNINAGSGISRCHPRVIAN